MVIHMRGLQTSPAEGAFHVIEKHRPVRVGKHLFAPAEVVEDGGGIGHFPPDSGFRRIAVEHGARNRRQPPQATVVSKKDAFSRGIGLLQYPDERFLVVRRAKEAVDELIGKEGDDAFKPATGAQLRLVAGIPAVFAEMMGMEAGQLVAKSQIIRQSRPQQLPFALGGELQSLPDGGQAEPLIALVFTHGRRCARHWKQFLYGQLPFLAGGVRGNPTFRRHQTTTSQGSPTMPPDSSKTRDTRVLVIDDEATQGRLLAETLQREGFAALAFSDAEQALARLKGERFDVLITDQRMPGMSGIDCIQAARRIDPDIAAIIVTAYATIETAVKAMKLGAFDFLTKPIDVEHLLVLLAKAEEQRQLIRENRLLREQLQERQAVPGIIGQSPPMQEVFSIVHRVAPTTATVLIRGESGTGKELIAKALHYHSPRCERPFVAVHSAALPETLLESELF
ncbi:MAG TPA: hypothetical protein DCZ69_15770, partial [Syntrophobacteraceae bacterium]|nr:hypothetical protein [Syntrophobacteraceae bacterium]